MTLFLVCWNLLNAVLRLFVHTRRLFVCAAVSTLILATLPHTELRYSVCKFAPSEMISSLLTGGTDTLLLWKLEGEFNDGMG